MLTIGYGRQVFTTGNRERARMHACALAAGALHAIVFSLRAHGCAAVREGTLHIYPTDSRSRVGMLFDAYTIGSRILKARDAHGETWVISAQDPFEAGFVGLLLRLRHGVPLQIQEHGDFFGGTWWRTERLLNRLRYVFGKWVLLRADCVRTVSSRARTHLVALGVPLDRISILAVASDLSAFAAGTPIRAERDLRARYPDAEAIVIAVGRLVKEKNIPLLIRAFGRVVSGHPTARLVIVGSGPEEKALRALAEKCGLASNITFVPWTDDVASYMKSADIFALSSFREGWGRIIIEAMAAGLPGVVTDVGCAGDAFVHGEHGYIVPVADEEAYAQALESLVGDAIMRRRYGEAARRASAAYAVASSEYARVWTEIFGRCRGNAV
ncbi:glycosyltransferase [Candidatus Kaiserbacteria bacterium]|nr:glycosyltransferase [Candidatus Kaiserbacteria bacterium]